MNVHDYLRSKLCDLYENDCIFDKFECTWSGDNKSIMTGSYNNMFTVFDRNNNSEVCMEAAKLSVKKSGGFINPNFSMKFGTYMYVCCVVIFNSILFKLFSISKNDSLEIFSLEIFRWKVFRCIL